MTTLKLGLDPLPLQVVLTTGADFTTVAQYRLMDGTLADWPVGTTLKLIFADSAGSEWSATISGSDATWDVDKATADTIPDGINVKVLYTNGTTERVLFTGTVARRG